MDLPATSNRIRKLRRASNDMTGTALAARLGVAKGTVSRWERGKTPVPPSHQQLLAETFAVSRDYLMGWDEEEALCA